MSKEQIKDTEKDLKKYASLEALTILDGGKFIIALLKSDILSAMNEICSKYKEVTHAELIAVSAKLSERLTLLRVLTRASGNKKITKEELEMLLLEEEDL